MAQEDILEDLRTEASCPVCLDFLRDPVTLDCGHHCCAACLQQRWQDLQDILPCPVCQHHCAYRKLQKNSQLSALVDMLKQLSSRGSKRKKQQEQPLCEQHQQELNLFCEKDLELVCAQCRGSCEQQGHPLIPTQEAAAQHRKKLKSHLQTLRQQLEDAVNGLEIQMKQRDQVREELKSQRIIACEMFEHYKLFFRENHRTCKFELQEVMTNVSQKITEIRDEMSAYSSSLKSLLSDLTKMSVQTDLGLLLKVRSLQQLQSRYRELKAPEAFSYTFQGTLSLPLYCLGLHNISKFQVALTLDPKTAHCNLIISEDRKKALFDSEMTVSNSTLRPEAFSSHTAVLSCEGFEAGRHFWMVEIRGSGEFSLGVCKESFPRQALGPQASMNDCWKSQQPVWTLFNSDTKKMIIGIFLDYELGEIWFYDISEMCPLCTITDSFTEKVRPYFAVKPSSSSTVMTIIQIQSPLYTLVAPCSTT